MIGILVQHQALMRELINGVAFILFLTLVLMITIFLWDTWVTKNPDTIEKWRETEGVKTACCLWWIFSAEAYRTCNVWISYNLGKVRPDGSLAESIVGVGIFSHSTLASTLGYLTAGVILCAGLLWAIYIWTPPEWRRKVWVYAALGAALFVSTPTIYDIIT